MRKKFALLIIVPLLISCNSERGLLYVGNVMEPVISLDGEWMISTDTEGMAPYLMNDNLFEGVVEVPGEVMMQGFLIKHDTPFVLRRHIDIPFDYKDKVVKLVFEGAYSYARVWVDSQLIREHAGGFTAWECDISDQIQAGTKLTLTVELTDRMDEISYGSGYAKHPIGGLLRSVKLMALPKTYPDKIIISTDFDNDHKDATLTVEGELVPCPENSTTTICNFKYWYFIHITL